MYNTSQRTYFIQVLILILGLFLLYASRIIFDAVMGAVIFTAILLPIHVFLTEKKHWNGSLSVSLLLLVSFFVLILPIITLSYMVFNKIMYYKLHTEELGFLKDVIWPYLQNFFNDKNSVEQLVNEARSNVLDFFSSALNGLSDVLLQVSVMYFLLFFLLTEHKKWGHAILKYLPFRNHDIISFGKDLSNITYANLLGQGLIAAVQGLLIYASFLLFNVPDALFWSVLGFFVCFIPMASPLIFIPAALMKIYLDSYFDGIGILIFGFVIVFNIDSVMRYYIAKRVGGIHPLITILGIIIGIPTFSILGLVYGPLMISWLIILVKIWEEQNRRK